MVAQFSTGILAHFSISIYSIEPEAVFGQMKNNMNYKRFRHFGKDKVFMDFAFFAIAFNIKKMCAKMTKEGMDWLIRPFYELTVVLFRC